MKFLIDNALSPDVAELLTVAGHEALHVRTLALQEATDDVIFQTAVDQERVLVSADTDFGTMLTMRTETRPSVILLRHGVPRRNRPPCCWRTFRPLPRTSRRAPLSCFGRIGSAFVVSLSPANNN